jgi:Ca2+-binding EF-hand superfamily protein
MNFLFATYDRRGKGYLEEGEILKMLRDLEEVNRVGVMIGREEVGLLLRNSNAERSDRIGRDELERFYRKLL